MDEVWKEIVNQPVMNGGVFTGDAAPGGGFLVVSCNIPHRFEFDCELDEDVEHIRV